MTKIEIISDLHLEASDFEYAVEKDTDLLILAGDISSRSEDIPNWMAKYIPDDVKVICIAGNHEFYNFQVLPDHYGTIAHNVEKRPNSFFLQNQSIILDDVKYIGSTLWTNFTLDPRKGLKQSMSDAVNHMNDYKYIYEKKDGVRQNLTPETVLEEFQKSLDFIVGELSKNDTEKVVVITHHGPCRESIHERYKHLSGNEYFSSDLRHIIEEHQPDFWIHGHTHQDIDYSIGKTRVIANPRGYGKFNQVENRNFKMNLSIQI